MKRQTRFPEAKGCGKCFSFIKNNIIYISIFFLIICFLGYYFLNNKNYQNAIFPDVKKIEEAIKNIHKNCIILNFLNENNPVDFLNVKEFSGNIIGSIQIEKPEKWEGPYLPSVILYKNKPFSIFVHKSGYYIVPGIETILDDEKVIGKDIIFNQETDMETILRQYPSLNPNGKALIKKIDIEIKNKI
jgi:hypothetical protein